MENQINENNVIETNTNEEVVETNTTEVKEPTKEEAELRAKIEAEIKAETQREIDRRVSEAVKKREAKLKAEAMEKERLAKLSEEEKIQELQARALKEQKERELLLNSRELKLEMIDYLAEKQVDIAIKDLIHIDAIAELEEADLRKKTLRNTIDKTLEIFNKAVDKKVESVKAELLKGQTPAIVAGETKAISEYDRARKSGNVKDMLLAKFN